MADIGKILGLLWQVFMAYFECIYRLFVPVPAKSVRGKIILVTGGCRGIGKAQAIQFGKLGAKIVLWDILKEENEKTAKELTDMGITTKAYVCDVTKYEEVQRVANLVRQEVGDVDILINNAGVLSADDILHLDEKRIRRTFEINSISHFWTVKEFLPKMIDNNEGHIVSIASMAGRAGVPLLTDYCASKFAVVGFTESLSEELRREGRTGIHTTTVCPMFVNTNLIKDQASNITYTSGPDPVLEADNVASEIVYAVLHNERVITIPRRLGRLKLLSAFFPWKVEQLIRDAIGSGFYYKN